MSNIDYKALITPQARAAQTSAAQALALKAECAAQITAVLDARTLSNLHGAVLAEDLTGHQMIAFRNAQKWMRDMRTACRVAIAQDSVPVWPALSDDVATLAKAY